MAKLSNKDKDKALSHDELRKKGNEKDVDSIKSLMSIRSKIERDYKEDILDIKFNTSPNTIRTVKAKRPSLTEMISIMEMSVIAAKYEGSGDADSLSKMMNIYNRLSEVASKLSIDKTLDKEFWESKVSFTTLQNFITSLIIEVQVGTGVVEKDMKKFR